ncbi:MAG: hypothetical protein Kow0031_14010 [Anaerolineae bacterium]
MLGLIGLFPLVWVARWLLTLKKPKGKNWAMRLAPWMVLLWLIVAISFVILHFVGVGVTTFGGSLFTVAAGFSRDYLWIFSLPWLLGLVTLVMVVIAVVSWLKGFWGMAGRVYYSLTTVLVVLYMLSLLNTGVFAVLFS